mmetsp:Transcript_21317/g.20623  ORF Transcript_21317/g.20623 Transcript_21317/m.20623 type:complete len:242 (+) Transcript_21317:79-804(+)
MTTSNPWGEKENAFSHGLRHLISSIPEFKTTNIHGVSNELTSDYSYGEELDLKSGGLIQKLRAADSCALMKREKILKNKIKDIQSEVKDVLSPVIIKDMVQILIMMTLKFQSVSNSNLLENISDDYRHKDDLLCIEVETGNQFKLNKLLSFAADLENFELISKSKNNGNDVSNSNENKKGMTDDTRNSDDNGSNSRDMLRCASEALNICDGMMKNGEILQDQYEKIKDFHEEFKNHILKSL